jgi:hypothetical protein
MAEPARPDVRYTAFLSYSHRDSAAAGRLHRRLEAYRMPKRLAGSDGARGPVPERLWPIFRDREELPAATDLSETVRAALAQSGALIILCSDHAAGSLWVAEEIETFRTLHPDRPILAAILDGEPPDCFPAALRAFSRDGTWHEPLATDLRPGKDGKQLGLLKLVAGITGVGLDALVQRDAARRVRRITVLSTMALIATLIMAALAVIAFNARREAERQRAEADGLVEFMHGDLRERLRGVGRLEIMRTVNHRALAYYDRQLPYARPADLLMRARVLQAIGEDEWEGNEEGAIRRFTDTYRTTAALLEAEPNDPDRIFSHAQSEYWVGAMAYSLRNYSAAGNRFERYRRLANQLLARNPAHPDWIREVAYAEGNLCSVAQEVRSEAGATVRLCMRALRRMEQVDQLSPRDLAVQGDLANRHAWVADAWVRVGRWDRVLFHRAAQERLIRSLLERDPQNSDYQDIWMRTQFTFGCLQLRHGDPGDSARRFADAADTAAKLAARDDQNAEWRRWRSTTAAGARSCPTHSPEEEAR